MADSTCAVDGCPDRKDSRGWCRRHYLRWWRTGDPGPAVLPRYGLIKVCLANGCERPHRTKGYCDMHYRRWKRGVAVTSRTFLTDPTPGNPDSYSAVHMRLAAVWGPASEYACVGCDADAHHWAYQHNDPRPMTSVSGMPYSIDLFTCYQPMCRSCHGQFDRDLDQREAAYT